MKDKKETMVEVPIRYLHYMSIVIANVDLYTLENMKEFVNGPLFKMAAEIHRLAIEKGVDIEAEGHLFMDGFKKHLDQHNKTGLN